MMREGIQGGVRDTNEKRRKWNYFQYFSIYRFIILVMMVSILWYTNPPNIPTTWNPYLLQQQQQKSSAIKQQPQQKSIIAKYEAHFLSLWKEYASYHDKKQKGYYICTTNYGIVSIVESISHDISILGLTGYELYTMSCDPTRYDARFRQEENQLFVCECFRLLCHEGSFFYLSSYDNDDNKYHYSYTIHRMTCYFMLIIAFWMSCYYKRRRSYSCRDDEQYYYYDHNIITLLLDSFISLWYDPRYPIISAIFRCFYNGIFIYPTLYCMEQIISYQHPQSMLQLFSSQQYMYNYMISLVSLLFIAIVINLLSKFISKDNICTLQYYAIIAVSIGYYAGIEPTIVRRMNHRSNPYHHHLSDHDRSNYLYDNGPSVLSIIFLLCIVIWYRKGLIIGLIWFIGIILAYSMGQYQYDNIPFMMTISNVIKQTQTDALEAMDTLRDFINIYRGEDQEL